MNISISGGFQPRHPERVYNKNGGLKTPPTNDLSGYNLIKNKYFPEKKNSVPVDPNTISITTDRNIPEMKEIVDTLMPDIIRQSEDHPDDDSIPNFDMDKETESDGLLGGFFDLLFSKEGDKKTTTTPSPAPHKQEPIHFKTNLQSSKEKFSGVEIPPFKSISSDFASIELTTKRSSSDYGAEDPLNMDNVGVLLEDDHIYNNNNYHHHQQQQHQKPDRENGTAIKNILLDLLGQGNSPFDAATTTQKPPPPPPQPKFPVHSLPYIATSNLQINPRPLEPIRNNLDALTNVVGGGVGATGQVLADDLSLTSGGHLHADYVVNPLNLETLKRHQSEQPAKIYAKPPVTKNKNDLGLLKLAGCNIYGRMYRVGRIISELSGPCLQCMCEEVGVHCTPLDC